jgi:glycosyltransferase involved in cell wall biosynthesis
LKEPRIAIVHDALVVSGGAEKLTVFLSQVFPNAPIFTSAYLPDKTFQYFETKKIVTLPGGTHVHNEKQFKRRFLQWFIGFRTLDLSDYDVVLSSSTYAAKFCKVKKNGVHICYLHSPFRLLWNRSAYSTKSLPYHGVVLWVIDRFIPLLQKIDRHYTNQITRIITNSQNMANSIKEIYGRDAEIIYPPIDYSSFLVTPEKKDYYLVVSRLLSYKRVDLAIRVCHKTNRRLIVIGEGPEKDTLKLIAGVETSFIGNVSENELKKYFAEARGLIFPGEEDFGLVPVEAQASGCPVIAYKAGGILETVIDGVTGILFDCQTTDSLLSALNRYEDLLFDTNMIREHAKRFDLSIFQEKLLNLVKQY